MTIKNLTITLAYLLLSSLIYAQAPSIEWQKSLGGSNEDQAKTIQKTDDGGYILAGYSYSTDGDVSGNHGSADYWIVKLNSDGDTLWTKCLGGSDYDFATSIQQTTDGGYIVAGKSMSTDGDVSGNHGDFDYWIVKLNSIGDTLWTKCLGGSNYDRANAIQQTTDGGYIVAGESMSTDGDVSGNHGLFDYWIVKLNSDGDTLWTKYFGGSMNDFAHSIEQTTDSGFIVIGSSSSNDGDVSGHNLLSDYWILKLNFDGDTLWTKCLGGSDYDYANSIQQTTDGGYIVAGASKSFDGDVSGNHGGNDYWILKLNSIGDTLWTNCFGGLEDDSPASILLTADGGYIVAGITLSADGDVSGFHGAIDYWIVKLNSEGDTLWTKCLGGSNSDIANSIQQTSGGGYIVAGNSKSIDGDVSGNNGNWDYWIVKLSTDQSIFDKIENNINFHIFPNPANNKLIIEYSVLDRYSNMAIELYDLQGKIMFSVPIIKQSDVKTIDVSTLPSGNYFITVVNKGIKVYSKQISIVH